MTWQDLENGNTDLAAFGRERFKNAVAYLATVRADGGPRVHPVTPIIGPGRLFVFMEPTSPKGRDLRRDGRYALHGGVEDSGGGRGEFQITGRATFREDAATRAIATQYASYQPAERYILFELSVESALGTIYEPGGPVRRRWSADNG